MGQKGGDGVAFTVALGFIVAQDVLALAYDVVAPFARALWRTMLRRAITTWISSA